MKVLRVGLSLTLVILFTIQMGLELSKYLDKRRTTTFTTELADEQTLPVFTLCSDKALQGKSLEFHFDVFTNTFKGWPSKSETVLEAWTESTALFFSLIRKVELHLESEVMVKNSPPFVSEGPDFMEAIEMDSVYFGRCFSVYVWQNLTRNGYLIFDFISSSNPTVYIHQPGQEIGVISNRWDPTVDFIRIKPGTQMDVTLTKHVTVSDPTKETCHPDSDDKSYVDCEKKFVHDLVLDDGINERLDRDCHTQRLCLIPQISFFLTPSELPWCNDTQEATCMLSRVEEGLRKVRTDQDIQCLRPCNATKFTGEKMDFKFHDKDNGLSRLRVSLATTNTLVQEDYILFDANALLASVGGSMGLFLGISFMEMVTFVSECIAKFIGKFQGLASQPRNT